MDLEGFQKMKEEIIESFSRMCMFLLEDMKDLSVQPAQESSQLQEMEVEALKNLDAVLKLVSFKFNDLSEDFKDTLRNHLKKFLIILNKFELGDVFLIE